MGMLSKLALRNAKRSFKDYFIYLITMIFITSLMFAFNSMIFSEDIQKISSEAGIMGMMIGLATFFIVLIIIWLIHYMIRFMAEKRSREFATYLLLGFHKKQVASLFFKETVILGTVSFLIGLIPGVFLQQVITTLIYAIVDTEYSLHLEFKAGTLLMTAAIFAGSYFLALIRNKKRFRKMNIRDMMYLDQQNEELNNGNKSGRQWMFFAAVLYMLFFSWMMVSGRFTDGNIYFMIIGLIVSVYFLYMGLSAFLIGYIRSGKNGVLKGANIFVLRQLASKVKTMQFTLGTLTILFMVALLGSSHALMLNQFQTTQADVNWPFDIAVYNPDPGYDFSAENELIKKDSKISSELVYQIFEDHKSDFRKFMEKYYSDVLENSVANDNAYFKYDTYMKLSDYNTLREMAGYEKISLEKNQYLIQIKSRLKDAGRRFSHTSLTISGNEYKCAGVYTEGFEQNGHNGADYLLVVPDQAADGMKPYYSLLAAQVKGSVQPDLTDNLLDLHDSGKSILDEDYYETDIDRGYGTDIMYVSNQHVYVREIETKSMKSLLSTIIFPLFYVGLVFLCVALTVLAVQQLSDSAKYKHRYSLLSKLGLREKEISCVILKQLFLYYLFPFITAIVISGGIVLYDSREFFKLATSQAPSWSYFGISILLFGGIYLIYFIATYVEFRRNIGVWEKNLR